MNISFAISEEDDMYGEIHKYLFDKTLKQISAGRSAGCLLVESNTLYSGEGCAFQNGSRLQIEKMCEQERVTEGYAHFSLG